MRSYYRLPAFQFLEYYFSNKNKSCKHLLNLLQVSFRRRDRHRGVRRHSLTRTLKDSQEKFLSGDSRRIQMKVNKTKPRDVGRLLRKFLNIFINSSQANCTKINTVIDKNCFLQRLYQNHKFLKEVSRQIFKHSDKNFCFPDEITASFRRFGPLVVDWPHKAESKSYFPPKGYAFLLFQVRAIFSSVLNNLFNNLISQKPL